MSLSSTGLKAVDSPVMRETSGVPYTFVMLTKLPTSNVDTPALTVSKVLDLFKSSTVGAIFSISNPLTNALPVDT